MKTHQADHRDIPPDAVPHMQIVVRETQRYVYVRWAWREKVNPRCAGEVRGTGRSKMYHRYRYIGVEADVVALLLRSKEQRKKR